MTAFSRRTGAQGARDTVSAAAAQEDVAPRDESTSIDGSYELENTRRSIAIFGPIVIGTSYVVNSNLILYTFIISN